MTGSTLAAPAKINLTLDILGRRPDGFHDMEMIMQSVSLQDDVTLALTDSGGIRAATGLRHLPTGQDNLAVAAALAFRAATGQQWEDLLITIKKRIPVCAGTAGGSSDAAAVLRGLNALTGAALSPEALAALGASVGSDVPYCVLGGTALARGRGEQLTPLPALPPCVIVLCKPRFSISTPALFQAWDRGKHRLRPDTAGALAALKRGDLEELGRRMFNVFEGVLPPGQKAEIHRIKNVFMQAGALGASMSGSGPTVLGLFRDRDAAQTAADSLRDRYPDVFLTHPV